MLNQSMISEKNRYSKYLDPEEVQVEFDDRSYVGQTAGAPALDRAADGDRLSDDMDDCIYSLNSEPRSARRPTIGVDEDDKIEPMVS